MVKRAGEFLYGYLIDLRIVQGLNQLDLFYKVEKLFTLPDSSALIRYSNSTGYQQIIMSDLDYVVISTILRES